MFHGIAICLAFIGLMGTIGIVQLYRVTRAEKREHFCNACFVIGYPDSNGLFQFCSACGMPEPMPISAPTAQAYLQRRKLILQGVVGLSHD